MAAGVMADFARMPAQRKLLVFIAIGALIGLVYWRFVYKSLDEQLEAAQVDHDSKVATDRRLAADIPRYEELRTHMTRLRELIEKNQTALPSAPELPAFFETLQRKVAESGVEIGKWTKRNEEPVESFFRVPVDIEISGTFMQIKRFFASLIQRDIRPGSTPEDRGNDDRERIVSIENLALANPTVKNREVVLSAKFTAVTFRQDEQVRPAGAPPAAGGAKPAAAPPPRPAPAPVAAPPPPLPSAATPAGAKARVDNALDKGAARNAGAAGAADGKAAGSDRLKGGL
ncbi:MAG TPA: type 4a pilus biogenesis protein PilO [Kofleriaceae bacterium]|jgi:Tfp pilus assembly protein PilO